MGERGDGGGALRRGPDAGLLGQQPLGGEDLVVGDRDRGAAALTEGPKHEVVTDPDGTRMPAAIVCASIHGSARSAPCSNARTRGAQPSAWTTTILGRRAPIQPSSSISAKAFHIPTMPVPPPVGKTMTSGHQASPQPPASASS